MAGMQSEPPGKSQDDVVAYPPRKKFKLADGSSANLQLSEPQTVEVQKSGILPADGAQDFQKSIGRNSFGNINYPIKMDPMFEQKLADSAKAKEATVGILEVVSDDHTGLFGIFKQRYADFLVNEIDSDGNVVHLETIADSKKVGNFAKRVVIPQSQKDSLSTETLPELVKESPGEIVHTEVATEPAVETVHAEHKTIPGSSGDVVKIDKDQDLPIQRVEPDFGQETTLNVDESVSVQHQGDPLITSVAAWQNFSRAGQESFTKERHIPQESVKILLNVVKQVTIDELNALHANIDAHGRIPLGLPNEVRIPDITDKSVRTQLHGLIRTMFHGRLQSVFDDTDGAIVVSPSAGGGKHALWSARKHTAGNASQKSKGATRRDRNDKSNGQYLHFSLLKINRDTMETVSFLARVLKIAPSAFAFSGTKDRRSVSVQRVSARRLHPDKLHILEKIVHNGHLGDWEYKDVPLKLGKSKGNEFVVTLRDVQARHSSPAASMISENVVDRVNMIEAAVSQASSQVRERGFINYFGLQRFGTYNARTNEVGQEMLRGNFEKAVDLILAFSEESLLAYESEDFRKEKGIGRDDASRAMAISLFRRGSYEEALKTMSRQSVAEFNIMRHLSQPNKRIDFQGALSSVNRNNRLMYVHAYQSIIWNLAASHRRKTWGAIVVEGDLVLVNEHKDKEVRETEVLPSYLPDQKVEDVDADGEIIIQPAADDRAINRAEADDFFERARALTAEEAASGKYNIFDIVLPLPGFDVLYPSHMVKFYEETMGSEKYGELDPHDMHRRWNDTSLPGSYRKLMAHVEGGVLEATVKKYKDNDEQFVETDIEKIMKTKNKDVRKQEAILPKGKANEEVRRPEAKIDEVGKQNSDEQTSAAVDEDDPIPDIEERVAVILKFRLGSSTYATMMLREFFKGGVIDFKAEYSGGH